MMKKLICYSLSILAPIVSSIFGEMTIVQKSSELPNDCAELYIDVMKRCLTNTIYQDQNAIPHLPAAYDDHSRENGLDWPSVAHTMVGRKRLDNIHFCVKEVLQDRIPGDLVETGVWRGGCTILMRAILKAYHDTNRKVWVVDSFEGLPPPNGQKYPADRGWDFTQFSILAVSLEQVKSNFDKYGLLDEQVVFLKGLFSETLPRCSIESIAVLRLDGDLYESTMDALVNLYPKLSVGGYIIIDDYGVIPPCAKAVHDYRNMFAIEDPILPIDGVGVYWRKSE